jgi:hypothetical protein
MVAIVRDDTRLAAELLRESAELDREAGDHAHHAIALRVLARALVGEDELDGAVEALRESLELAERLDDAAGTAEALETLAVVAARRDDPVTAARLIGRAEALREPVGVPRQADHAVWIAACEEELRRELGEERFAAELQHGRTATTDEVSATAARAAWPGR